LNTNKVTSRFRGCKVAILGTRRSGKSCLAYALADIDNPVPTPHSVNIHHISRQTEHMDYYEVSLWDFSGHDGYRVIHELLLDDVDIVLITLDFTQPITAQYEAIDYWVDMIRRVEARQQHRIIRYMVMTKVENLRQQNRNKGAIARMAYGYGFDDIFYTSYPDGRGISDLRNALFNSILWEKTQQATDYENLAILHDCIVRHHEDEYTVNRHELYVELLEASDDLVSTAEYNMLLDALQFRGTIFQFPLKDDLMLDVAILEYYVARVLEIPREPPRQKSSNKQFFPVSWSDILQHPVPVNLDISVEQHRNLNGLILHLLAFRNLLILDNKEIIFLSNLVQELPRHIDDYNGALILDMSLFPSMNFPQLVVRINRSQEYRLAEYWSNHAIFKNDFGKYHIIHPAATQTLTAVWIFCTTETPDYHRLLFETYVYDLITDMGNVATLETRRHYVCENCGTEFNPEDLEKNNRVACIFCQSINNVPTRPSQLAYEDQLQLLQDAERIIKQSASHFDRSLANYRIELSKLDNIIDCMLIFERDSDVARHVLRVNADLREDGMHTFLLPTRGMEGINLYRIEEQLLSEQISRIVYFIGGNQQLHAQTPLIDIIQPHYKHLKLHFLPVVVHPTIISSTHPLINRGFNLREWSPDSDQSTKDLLHDIRDNHLEAVQDVHGRLDNPKLQKFPYFGEALLHFFSIDNYVPLIQDTLPTELLDLLVDDELDINQFWRADLTIPELIITYPASLIYIRRAQVDNEFKVVMRLRRRYEAEFIIIVDVNALPAFPFKGTSKFIHLDVRALRDLITTVDRNGWFRRYLVRNLRGGGSKVIEKMLPFDTNKIADDDIFYGREDFIDEIEAEIASKSLRGRFIFGPKRSGKTSLLHRIKGVLEGTQYEPILLTAGGSSSIQTFIQSILSYLELEIDEDLTPDMWVSIMRQFQWDYGRTPVLFLDEMDQLIQEDRQKNFQLSRAIAELVHRDACVFFLAGHSVLRREASNGYSIYFNLMPSYYARGIESDEAFKLLQAIVSTVDFRFTPDQLEDIYDGTGGVPYLMIHFCQELLNSMVSNLEEQKTSFDQEIEYFEIDRVKAKHGFLSTVHNFFMYDHHDFLEIILKLISESDTISREDIIDYLSNLQIPNAEAECNKVFQSLIDLFEIVVEHDDGTLTIRPRYLHLAFKKKIGKHKSLDDMETYLLSETPPHEPPIHTEAN